MGISGGKEERNRNQMFPPEETSKKAGLFLEVLAVVLAAKTSYRYAETMLNKRTFVVRSARPEGDPRAHRNREREKKDSRAGGYSR